MDQQRLTKSLKFCFFVLLLITMSGQILAASQLTLNDITKIAIQNNNDLKAAQYSIHLAEARLIQAGLWSNPSLNLGNIDDRLLTNEGEYTRSAGFSQAFPISGRIGRQKNIARVDVAIAMAEIRNAKRLLRAAVANNYYALLITDYRLELLNKLLAINRKLVQVTQNRFRAAEVSELDTNTASLEYQRILQEKQILESLRINQTAQLNQLLARDASSPLLLNKSLPQFKPLAADLSGLQALAIKQRPDMQMLWLGLNRSQADQQLARTTRWADWTLGLAVQENKTFVTGGLPQNPDRAFSVSLAIPLPILNANQGKIKEAGITGTQAMAKMRALKLTIQTEIASNYAQLLALHKALQQSRQSTIKLKNRNVNLARSAFKNGQISLLEVLQIQRQQTDLQTAYLNMLEKYLQAIVKFCAAIGSSKSKELCPYF